MTERAPSGIYVWHFDDHAGNRTMVKFLLGARGFRVNSLGNPATARRELNEGLAAHEIGLLIVDGSIDYLDGAGNKVDGSTPLSGIILADTTRWRSPEIPIVLCSDRSRLFEQHRGLLDAYVGKPIKRDVFYQAIDQAWVARRRPIS